MKRRCILFIWIVYQSFLKLNLGYYTTRKRVNNDEKIAKGYWLLCVFENCNKYFDEKKNSLREFKLCENENDGKQNHCVIFLYGDIFNEGKIVGQVYLFLIWNVSLPCPLLFQCQIYDNLYFSVVTLLVLNFTWQWIFSLRVVTMLLMIILNIGSLS